MSFLLGIDTGGTYTDGVIVDAESRRILCKAKALTTKADLTEGIRNCLEQLEFEKMNEISLVSLSTTLATNAIVEGRGGTVGVLYMGAELDDTVPADYVVKIEGKFDIMGRLQTEPDEQEIRTVLSEMKHRIEALAVSGYASVRNPEHELLVKQLAEELLEVPVICGHQLTSALGFHHRTVTAALNGRLVPIIKELLQAVRAVLQQNHIQAPLMVVKGDGSLMTEQDAMDRPIETILSGPAASVIGGLALTGKSDGIVLDMGGTTTDIAEVSGGTVRVKQEGAKVGGWHTRVQAVEISTFGLGGDSCITLDRKGKLRIGPEKVWPLCLAGERYPYLIHELRSFRRKGELKHYFAHEADCYLYGRGELPESAPEWERKIVESLKQGAHSITYLAKMIGKDPESIDLTHLVKTGILQRAAVTPTDLLHERGVYCRWNRELSHAGLQILADRKEMPLYAFLKQAETEIHAGIALDCLQSAADFEGEQIQFSESPEALYLLQCAFGSRSSGLFQPEIRLKKPLVALGAPAGAWIAEAAKKLHTEIIVPEHADVANAYGAAVGQVTETVELLISFTRGRYILNTPWQRFEYGSREEALFYAIHEGRKHIEHRLAEAGCHHWKIEEASSDIMVALQEDETQTYAGTKMIITGTGSSL